MRSSIARREYEAAQRKQKTKPKIKPKVSPAKPPPKPKPKAKPQAKPKAKKTVKPKAKPKAKPTPRIDLSPPWEREGIVREYPDPDEWFPEVDFYGYDELLDEWGDYDDEDTDS